MNHEYTIKHADGTGRLQRGYYVYNESSAAYAAEVDRFTGPWRTELGARSAIRRAEGTADPDDTLMRAAIEAGKTPSMRAARATHERIRLYMEG
jgi:hypothetical protein